MSAIRRIVHVSVETRPHRRRFDAPEALVSAVRRIVHVSVETARIVSGLPAPFAVADVYPDGARR